jgi:GDPmannose 4,6-dehydratase
MFKKKALITGITSQDGAYLAKLLLEKDYEVFGLVRNLDSKSCFNLNYLKINNFITLEICDLTNSSSVINIINKINPDELYNLAAQSSVAKSFQDPLNTIQFNCTSVINLLEAMRLSSNTIRFFQAASSEIYGINNKLPFSETSIINPISPYATSKAFAYWTVKTYRDSYNLFAASGILFNHESFLRPNHFFIKKIIVSALQIKFGLLESLTVGNIDVKRDFGSAQNYVEAMWLILQSSNPDDFIICSGKSISLREIVYYIFDKLHISRNKIIIDSKLYRPLDIQEMYGDNTKIKSKLNWNYTTNFFDVLDTLIEEELNYGTYY